MKKVAPPQRFPLQESPLVTTQDVVYVLVLVALSLLFSLVPKVGLGQALPEINPIPALDSMSNFVPAPPTQEAQEPAAASFLQAGSEVHGTAFPFGGASVGGSHSESSFPLSPPPPVAAPVAAPVPVTATASPVTANQQVPEQVPARQSIQPMSTQPMSTGQPLPRSPQQNVTVNVEHPFRSYLGIPNDPQTKIAGKPMTVAELFTGTRSPAVRCQLLQAYWELSGLLAIYHFRCETERQASRAAGTPQEGILLSEQRRTAEIEFIKQQWVLAKLLRQYKGRTLRESELPIPTDYPLYPRYQTHAERIARTERTQHLGRMIPIQEQLIESKNGTWKAASEMAQSASQPFFAVSAQRTMAFLELTHAIIEYNKMIAEYALETIPPHVSQQQLVGAVVRLPRAASLQPPQTLQRAAGDATLSQYNVPAGMPAGVTAQHVEQVAHEFPSDAPPTPPSFMIPGNEPPKSETSPEPSSLIRDLM